MNKEKFAPKIGSKAFNPASHARRHNFTHIGQNFDKCPSSPRSPILSIDLFSIRNSANSTRKNRYGVAPQQKEYKELIRKYPHCKQQSIKRSKSNPIFLEREKEAFKSNGKKTNDKFKRVR